MRLLATSILLAFFSINLSAHERSIQEVECKLEILNARKSPHSYTLHGSIKEKTGFDYLTLEPNTSSGAKFTARILLTVNYDPVTIHPRGNTVTVVASGDLAQTNEVHLEHLDEDNETQYILDCKNL